MPDLCGVGHHVRWLIVTRDRSKSLMAPSEITLEAVSSVSQIPAGDWDACANPAAAPDSLDGLDTLASSNTTAESCATSTSPYNPFVSHAFFSSLEESGSACARTGWGPRHLRHAFRTRPHFVAYWVNQLPAPAPWIARNIFGLPLLTWTVRTPEQRQRAARYADQMIFEGFRP